MGLTINQIAKALEKSNGINAEAGRILGVTGQAIADRVRKSKKLQAVKEDVIEGTLDRAENKLIKAIDRGDLKAVMFYLRTIGKGRGYTERQEVTGQDGAPLVHIYMPDNGRDDNP